MHQWSGRYGVPGGTERWEHRSYRWRRGLEAALLVVLVVVLAPKVLALMEVVAGAGLMALGLLVLVVGLLNPRHLRHPLADGLILGGLVGWAAGRRRR
jgi:hypothetical protein